jgi:hypothetical protein
MNTLNWRGTSWTARNFIFSIGDETIGQLTFGDHWSFNAAYTDKQTHLKFTQKSFWDRDVVVTSEGNTIGEIHSGPFSQQTLRLGNGERFSLSTSFWEQEAYWKTDKGETVVKYQQATMSSMGKGLITLEGNLGTEREILLVCSGLFARQMARKRIRRTAAIMIPMIAAASRL